MATNNRGGGTPGGTRRRNGRNNNPEGRNQYSRSPLATAATVGGAVAAGIFLWSRRNQISEQLGNLAEQIGDWREGIATDSDFASEDATAGGSVMAASESQGAGGERTQAEIAEEALTLKEIGKPA